MGIADAAGGHDYGAGGIRRHLLIRLAIRQNLCSRSVVLLGRVDAGNTPAATNYQWVFQTSVDVILLACSSCTWWARRPALLCAACVPFGRVHFLTLAGRQQQRSLEVITAFLVGIVHSPSRQQQQQQQQQQYCSQWKVPGCEAAGNVEVRTKSELRTITRHTTHVQSIVWPLS
jgi:hypothetical protein